MIRKPNRLVLLAITAVITALALSGTASAAQFHAESAPASIEASNFSMATFTFKNGQLDCQPRELTGTMSSKTAESLTLSPVYVVGCAITYEGGGTSQTTIMLNGCQLKLHANNTGSFVCPAGQSMTFPSTPCTLHIQPVAGSESVTYTNNGKGIDVTIAMTNVPYSLTGGIFCKTSSGTGTYEVSTHLEAGAKLWFE